MWSRVKKLFVTLDIRGERWRKGDLERKEMRAQRIKKERREKEEESSKNQREEGNPSLREANFEDLRGKGEFYSPLGLY